jgi:coenzyme F420-reducing hydrogenase alpha subunit
MNAMAAGEKAHGPADGEGGSKSSPAERQRSFADADELVERARGHLEAYEDPDDEMEKRERLGRAAECLRQAAESMRPKSGSQHFRMR